MPARILEKTWLPQLAITAMEGYPLPENGGNVLLPYSVAKLVAARAAHLQRRSRAPGGEDGAGSRPAL